MSAHTEIQWTDATWNPTTGCTKVSPGCANCYIERTAAFRIAGRKFVKGATDLRLHENRLEQPLHWRKPRRVFVNSLSDLFHEAVPDAFIDQVFAVMALCPQHTFQILTKRPERMRAFFDNLDEIQCAVLPSRISQQATSLVVSGDIRKISWNEPPWPLPNVWLGVSVENQHFADERIPLLLQTPAAVRFLSCEPLLGHLNIAQFIDARYISVGGRQWIGAGGIGWVIGGGESGHGARSSDLAWFRSLRNQCAVAGVAFFMKQLGANWFDNEHRRGVRGSCVVPVDSPFTWVKLRDKKGGDMAEWPSDLQVREWPS